METFDLVDAHDNVIGTTDKQTAHRKKQPHRVAAVYVFNSSGELYVQVHKASGGLLDHSVGGHVKKGESYKEAAVREAKEELSIDQPLTKITTFYSDEGEYIHMFGLFECRANQNWAFKPNNEVEQIIPMKIETIFKMMQEEPQKFTGGFINTMSEYLRQKNINI